MTFKSD